MSGGRAEAAATKVALRPRPPGAHHRPVLPPVPPRPRAARAPVALVVVALAAVVPGAVAPPAADARGGDDARVRTAARCGRAAATRLELRGRDGGIRMDWRLERGRARERWRVVVVQEGRVAWRGTRSIAGSGELRLRLTLRDLSGADRVEVRASGPRGTACGVAATLTG